jgi:hypothetical protein
LGLYEVSRALMNITILKMYKKPKHTPNLDDTFRITNAF